MIARGAVIHVRSGAVDVQIVPLALGTYASIACNGGWKDGIVTATSDTLVTVAVANGTEGIVPGAIVEEQDRSKAIVLGAAALGRALDAAGTPLDGGSPLHGVRVSLPVTPVDPMHRVALDAPLWTGVRAIDGLLSVARGARVGIFGAPGAGKSTLIETIVAGTNADAVVVALIGERGREAERWIARRNLRTTIVCATSDRPARERIAAAHTAFAQAQALARRGLHVLLILDSLARVAHALREDRSEVEPAGRGGYPPSVFAELASLVESAGAFRRGSVSLVATVLNDGGDDDPVSEAARSLLDGHIQLTRELAQAGRFPAIDVLASASRTMTSVTSERHQRAAALVRTALSALSASADLRSLGLEPRDPTTLTALAYEQWLEAFLRQGPAPVGRDETLAMLLEIADTLGEPHEHRF